MGSVAPANPATSRLFKPVKLGNHTVQHRVVLAPLTRNRSDEDHVPMPFAAKYYADRGAVPGTLVITEATSISHAEEGQANVPGFVSDAQSARWKDIITAVHANNSIFFQQIWGIGRAATPDYVAKQGLPYRSSSATPMKGSDATPTAMTEEEIQQTITDFVETAKRVRAAGGDGVEIHSAHGYLLDQFLSDAVNKRTDKWGGSPENRARLTIEVVKQVSAAIGAGNVALRLSPYAGFQGADKSDIVGQYTYLIQELKKADLKLAYLSLVEARGDPAHIVLGASQLHEGKTLDFILNEWDNQSPVVVAGGYTGENAQQAVDGHYAKWDVLVAFGRHFLANPDLPFRIRHGVELNAYDRSTFYKVMSEDGYTDYPFSKEFLEAENKSVSNE